MPAPVSIIEEDITMFTNTAPPPPYRESYDLSPIPHTENRPRLPEQKRNPHLSSLGDDATIVKFQTIVRENKEIVVGRIKVPTVSPTGGQPHAFILRRYDTDAISLTTMFKVAFPGATEEEEKREAEWVKSSFDTRNTNGGRGTEIVRLAGLWVSRHLAIHLAPAYGMSTLVAALARASPDPNVQYRKSIRSQQAAEEMSQDPKITPAVPQLSAEGGATPVAKRQRRSPAVTSSSMAVDDNEETRHLTIEATTTLTAPAGTQLDMEAEISSAKQLVKDLRRELKLRSAAGEDLEDTGAEEGIEGTRGKKRGQSSINEAVVISGGTGGGKGQKRVIVANKRVENAGGVVQGAKKVAWGALIFGLGVGAATLIPQFASSFF